MSALCHKRTSFKQDLRYVIYPVDCLPSESAFREAYAAWHMAGGGPPVTTKWVTVTRSDMITFENANR